MEGKRLMVIFPGGNYGADSPLLYYARLAFELHGYETVYVHYNRQPSKAEPLQTFIHDNQQCVTALLQKLDFSIYDDVVFVSKSVGTVFAGWAEETLGVRVRHIMMTPLIETLPYIQKGNRIAAVVGGTADTVLDAGVLRAHCEQEGVHLVQFSGAGHRLEAAGDIDRSIDILRVVAALCLEKADWPAVG